jgi:hypothetical protein
VLYKAKGACEKNHLWINPFCFLKTKVSSGFKVEENDILDILQYADIEKLSEIQTESLGCLDTFQHIFNKVVPKYSPVGLFSC